MRALTIVSALALTLSALAACSAQPEGTPPRGGGADTAGTSSSSGGQPSSFGGAPPSGSSGTPGDGFAGAPPTGFGGASSGFAGAPPAAGAGAPGTGGGTAAPAACTMTKVGTGTAGLIDDFETHPMTANIPSTDGRVGGWWVSLSATGMVTAPAGITSAGGNALPVAGGLPAAGGMGTGMALHLAGTDSNAATGWGADVSVALTPPTAGNCYDASAYTGGIKVSMMGMGSVYVSVITIEDRAAMATSGNQRDTVAITSTWTDYTIPWSALITGWGTPIPLDVKAIVALDFAPAAASATNFDFWIDNVQFLP